ncbi:MAG TPA: hypothetical protein P5016_12895 [Verrucomicrobiales bacterium]|nr:hypothetical protein [Verrucomicrobiae bacterium]HRX55411.1 hypothetical protein [Verrucomicrobiales bacterium]
MSSRTADVRDNDQDEEAPMPGGSLFLWGVLIVFLIALNAFAWIFCIFVFGNPEVPFNYKLLTSLNKLENIEGFTPVTAPRGKFKDAKELYLEQYRYSDEELEAFNGLLKRAYLDNYDGKNYDVVYLSGEFRIESARLLTKDDIFPYGFAIMAQAVDFPSVYVDYILPAMDPKDPTWKEKKKLLELTRNKKDKDKNALKQLRALDKVSQVTTEDLTSPVFAVDATLKIDQSETCATFLHVTRLQDEKICISVVPMVEKDLPLGENRRSLKLSPPSALNLTGTNKFPLADLPVMAQAQPESPPIGPDTVKEPASKPPGE